MSPLALPFVSTREADLLAVRTDRSGEPGEPPLAVARPATVAEVQALLRAAHATGTPLVPRGAGTGLAGGALGRRDAVVLDLSGLDRILDVDPVNRLAVVEPGVVTAELDAAVAVHGLRYSPDPASAALSTIGGNLATNAGGLRCLKYGVTRDAVRSLDVVLADGTLLRTGAATTKSVVGYDLASLFVGSQGTLGVIVGATLALDPAPTCTWTLSAAFTDVAAAAAAVTALLSAGVRPAMAELVDGATLAAIDAHLGTRFAAAGRTGALLLVQTDSLAAADEIETARAVVAAAGAEVVLTDDPAEADVLLAARRAALPAVERHGTPLIEDICVPVSRLADAFTRIREIAATTGARVYTVAHAGDGNLHPIIIRDADGTRAAAAAEAVFALALELGGTVSGEHGTGTLKSAWAARELGEAGVRVHRAIRAALDPVGILNPNPTFH